MKNNMTKERAAQLLQIMIDHLAEYEDCRGDDELTNLLMAIGFTEEDLKCLGFEMGDVG